MRIVAFGTASFAVPALRAVAPHVVLAVSQPDRPKGRGLETQPSPFKQAALDLGLPVETPERARDAEFIARIRGLKPDFLLVAAYGQILPVALLEAAKFGGINLHGSILPEYRGAAPIQRCLLEGHTETGVTLMQMEKGMDTGDVIAIEKLPIGPEETYGELQDRLAELAGKMATEWAPKLAAGDYPRAPQDHSRATHAAKIEKQEAELNWFGDAAAEHNRYRAFTPAPGATLNTKFGLLRLSKAQFCAESGNPGEALLVKGGLRVAFRHGSLDLLELQPAGKKRMSGADFANGMRLRAGDSLLPEPNDSPTG